MKFILLALVSSLFLSGNVLAAEDTSCSYKSQVLLNKAAYNVEANYTINETKDGNKSFTISIHNITEDIYAVVSNNVNNDEFVVNSEMVKDSVYSFTVNDITTIITYNISIRSLRYGCAGEIRKMEVVKPRYNDVSELKLCKEKVLENYTYCQKWVNRYYTETREEIIEKINNQYNRNLSTSTTRCISCQSDEENKEIIKKKQNIRMIIIIGLVIGIVLDSITIAILIIRKKKYEI